MTEKEKELAEYLIKKILEEYKKDGVMPSKEVLDQICANALKNTKSLAKPYDNIDENFFDYTSIKNINTGLTLYGINVRILGDDFIRAYSSGVLNNYDACVFFLEKKYLSHPIGQKLAACIKESPAYFTHIEFEDPIVNPFFIKGGNNILSTLFDAPISDINDVIHYEKYVVVDSEDKCFEKYEIPSGWKHSALLKELRDGKCKIKVETGGKAIKYLLSNFDLHSTEREIIAKYSKSTKGLPQKAQKRLALIRYLIDNDIDINNILMSVIAIPQVDEITDGLPDSVRADIKVLYRRIAGQKDEINHLCYMGSPKIIIANSKRMLQDDVERLFKKLEKTFAGVAESYINKRFLDNKNLNFPAWYCFIAMLMGLDISNVESEKLMFHDFLLDQNAFDDKAVWGDLA